MGKDARECKRCHKETDGVGESVCGGCQAEDLIERTKGLKKYQKEEDYRKSAKWGTVIATKCPPTGCEALDALSGMRLCTRRELTSRRPRF